MLESSALNLDVFLLLRRVLLGGGMTKNQSCFECLDTILVHDRFCMKMAVMYDSVFASFEVSVPIGNVIVLSLISLTRLWR